MMSREDVKTCTTAVEICGPTACVEDVHAMLLEPRPFRPFKTSEEYLYAMKEDLAEWLNALYGLDITVDNFLERLETGVILCRHANNVHRIAREWQQDGQNGLNLPIPQRDIVYRTDVQPGTFQSRDNVSNFISWCRKLDIKECLLFETDDLVLRKNEKSFILCLLEIARQGSKFGMPAPLLVQMEEEIDAELANEDLDCECQEDLSEPMSNKPQIITNDLRSLHERVVDLLGRCTCPSQFPMIRVSEGKYRIGDTKILIFVRILRNHVMVRVGGGWDTLEHYLDKHDPCRCKSGHRFSTSAKLTISPGKNSPHMQVTYSRPTEPNIPGSKPRSLPSSPQTRHRILNTIVPRFDKKDTNDSLKYSYLDNDSSPGSCIEDMSKLCGRFKPTQVNNAGHLDVEREKKWASCKVTKMGRNGEESNFDSSLVNGYSSLPLEVEYSRRRISAPQESRNSKCCKILAPRPGVKTVFLNTPNQILKTVDIKENFENMYPSRVINKQCVLPVSNNGPVFDNNKERRYSDSISYPLDVTKRRPHKDEATENGFLLTRNSLRRHSYRAPRTSNFETKIDPGYKTWSFRQRSPRVPLSTDIFQHEPQRSQSLVKPHVPRARGTDFITTHTLQKQTASKTSLLSTDKMQKLLKDVNFDTDHDFLAEMEKFIENYKAKVEKRLNEEQASNFSSNVYQKSTNSESDLPDEEHSSHRTCFQQATPPKARSQSIGSSKIPMSVRYYKREW
ncbi:uncharacterized protein LOC143239409 [Tachypleus tridentatus]|uniref:uncharacterized protein LOC143239409 n=1 Tax=Tachypleus tridentatus TaxID=6853 RepID=UPI003FD2CD37